MSQRPRPPSHYSFDPPPGSIADADDVGGYFKVDEESGAWLGLALICGVSGALVGALIIGLIWWLS